MKLKIFFSYLIISKRYSLYTTPVFPEEIEVTNMGYNTYLKSCSVLQLDKL